MEPGNVPDNMGVGIYQWRLVHPDSVSSSSSIIITVEVRYQTMPAVVLVTGGTGLVGKAIEYVIEHEPQGSRFGKQPGEKWIFASSREADLRYLFNLSRGQGRFMCRSYEQGSPTDATAL